MRLVRRERRRAGRDQAARDADTERRARFRKVVKVALGVCVACCLVATGATALSTNEAHARTSGVGVKTAPASGATPVEKLEIVLHTKAPGSRVAARTPKWGKRR